LVGEPPPEERWRRIERPAEYREPRRSEFRLKLQPPGRPLGSGPDEDEHDGADQEYLAPEDLGRVHRSSLERRWARRQVRILAESSDGPCGAWIGRQQRLLKWPRPYPWSRRAGPGRPRGSRPTGNPFGTRSGGR